MQFYDLEEVPARKRFKSVLRWAVSICSVLALAVFVVIMYGDRAAMSGQSMEPVLSDGDVVLLDKLCYDISGPARFDVIAFSSGQDDTKVYIKRIIGLPGETVTIADGQVYIDGEPLEYDLPLITSAGLAADGVTLGEGEYFVLGDAPDTSEDSRFSSIGNVTLDQIWGKVWLRISPLSSFGTVK